MILYSCIASLISISNKFVYFDVPEKQFADKARSLKQGRGPNCISYWYILRVLWRVSDIMSKFSVYVLIWVVLGGAWLPIWCGFLYII